MEELVQHQAQPIVEVSSGVVKEVPAQAGMQGPHVETSGPVPDATGNDTPHENPIPGTVPEPVKKFDGLDYFKSLSMTPEAQDYFSTLVIDAGRLRKLEANAASAAIVALLEKIS